ncbi:MAG: hypothetical protein SGILL_006547, partial [Bacillariaceae sp.]
MVPSPPSPPSPPDLVSDEGDQKATAKAAALENLVPGSGAGFIAKIQDKFKLPDDLAVATHTAAMELGPDDPGFTIMFADANTVHDALAMAGSPMAQRATATLSLAALRNWVVAQAVAVNAGCVVAMPANAHNQGVTFTNMSITEATNFRIGLWAHLPWAAACHAASTSAGSFFEITGEGTGR